MPKLLLFAACEKVLIDKDNIISLISLLQDLQVQVPKTESKPESDSVIPMKWDVLSIWRRTDDDEGKTYEQRIELVGPTGDVKVQVSVASFEVSSSSGFHRVIASIIGFPIGATGLYTVRLWLTEKGQQEGQPLAEYPITVVYDSATASSNPSPAAISPAPPSSQLPFAS